MPFAPYQGLWRSARNTNVVSSRAGEADIQIALIEALPVQKQERAIDSRSLQAEKRAHIGIDNMSAAIGIVPFRKPGDLRPFLLRSEGESWVSFLASCGLFFQRGFEGELGGRDVAEG